MSHEKKCVEFVRHIQNHLDNQEFDKKVKDQITPNKVGCKICNLDVDEIYGEQFYNLSEKLTHWFGKHQTIHRDAYDELKSILKEHHENIKEDIDKKYLNVNKTTKFVYNEEWVNELFQILDKQSGEL